MTGADPSGNGAPTGLVDRKCALGYVTRTAIPSVRCSASSVPSRSVSVGAPRGRWSATSPFSDITNRFSRSSRATSCGTYSPASVFQPSRRTASTSSGVRNPSCGSMPWAAKSKTRKL